MAISPNSAIIRGPVRRNGSVMYAMANGHEGVVVCEWCQGRLGGQRTAPPQEAQRAEKGDTLSATVLYMSMSFDGFIAGPNAGPGNGLGDGGDRLHEWLFTGAETDQNGVPSRPAGTNGQIVDEFMATGAVVAGRGTFEPAGGWVGDHHDGVPIFVLARRGPSIDIAQWPLVSYVSDVRTAMSEA